MASAVVSPSAILRAISVAVRLFKLISVDSVTFHRFAKRPDMHFADFVLQTSAYAAEVNHLNRQIEILYKSQKRYYEPFSQTVSIIIDARGAPIVSDIFLNASALCAFPATL